MDVTSDTIPATTAEPYYTINIPGSTYKNGYMKKISITCNDNGTLMRADLTTRDVATGETALFWRVYFITNGEWDLNDSGILDTEEYILTLVNYAGGGVLFTANLSYIEV